MSSSPSARPPKPNNLPDVRLGDPAVEAFLNRATGAGEGKGVDQLPTVDAPQPAAPAPPRLDLRSEASYAPPPMLAQAPVYQPPAQPREAMRPWTMRLPPDIHDALKWITANGGPSMNEFILQALREAIPPAVDTLSRAQAMGLILKGRRG
jgi:hypothetical protein